MSRFLKLALGAAVALSLAAALVVGCSGDDQAQPQQQQEEAQQTQTQQQQQDDTSGSAGAGAAQPQQQQPDVTQEDDGEPLNVVVSTQVIADWVRQVGGDRVSVRALVPAGADAHTLELSVADIRAIADADLVIINGAGLEAAYEDAILENAEHVLNLAEAIEAAGYELDPFSAMMADAHDDHDDEDDHGHEEDEDDHAHEAGDDDEMHEDDHDEHGAAAATGRLLITDPDAGHLSVLDLMTEELTAGAFEFDAPPLAVYASPTHRYAFVLARGEGDNDDGIHLFDGGVYLVAHDDHYDLVSEPVSRHALEIAEERPIHYVNSYGWTAIFSDARGHVFLINEAELAAAQGDYEPIVLDTGPQHGAALVISGEHVIVTTKNPDFPDNSDDSLPVGVEVRTFADEVVYDASNRSCPGMHGESHNDHGAAFGCVGGVLFLHAHDGEYEHEFIANPPEMREESRIGSVYGHHHVEHFFGRASYFDGQGFADDGIWLIDVAHGEMYQVFSEPSVAAKFSSDGELLYVLGADGVLHALDAHDGELVATMELVAPGEAGRPAMIIVGETMYVADPNSGHVLVVHLDELEIAEEIEVGGAPSSLAFVGVLNTDAPEAGHDEHDEDEMHDEDHDEDEEHEQHEEEEHDDHGDEEDAHAGHDHGDEDPHFWFDTELAGVAVNAIADELSGLNPAAADGFVDNLERYLGEIADADAEVRALLADLPEEQRLLVTFHDAFGYFARRYGLTVAGFVVEGPEQGVSAASLTELIELIEHEGVTTVFHEPQFDSNVIDTIADEAGVQRGIIWSQPTDDQPTYLDILLGNARAIAEQ